MCHTQTCRGACEECALPQASTFSGYFLSEVGATRKENQESEALMLLLKFWDVCDRTVRGISDGCLHLEHVMVIGCSASYSKHAV